MRALGQLAANSSLPSWAKAETVAVARGDTEVAERTLWVISDLIRYPTPEIRFIFEVPGTSTKRE